MEVRLAGENMADPQGATTLLPVVLARTAGRTCQLRSASAAKCHNVRCKPHRRDPGLLPCAALAGPQHVAASQEGLRGRPRQQGGAAAGRLGRVMLCHFRRQLRAWRNRLHVA